MKARHKLLSLEVYRHFYKVWMLPWYCWNATEWNALWLCHFNHLNNPITISHALLYIFSYEATGGHLFYLVWTHLLDHIMVQKTSASFRFQKQVSNNNSVIHMVAFKVLLHEVVFMPCCIGVVHITFRHYVRCVRTCVCQVRNKSLTNSNLHLHLCLRFSLRS